MMLRREQIKDEEKLFEISREKCFVSEVRKGASRLSRPGRVKEENQPEREEEEMFGALEGIFLRSFCVWDSCNELKVEVRRDGIGNINKTEECSKALKYERNWNQFFMDNSIN